MTSKILIVGAGQLGSRHLQSLARVSSPLTITVVDTSMISIQTAKERWLSVQGASLDKDISFYLPQDLPRGSNYDIAIFANNSDTRYESLLETLSQNKIRNIILEKILFNTNDQYTQAQELITSRGIKAYVNCPMRQMSLYRDIKEFFQKGEQIFYRASGSNFGLITNAIHYLDHFAYLVEDTSFRLETTGLHGSFFESKRKGFLEINGTLSATNSTGSHITISSLSEGNLPIVIQIESSNIRIISRESEGKVWISKKSTNWSFESIDFRIPYQSELTAEWVSLILEDKKIPLTPFNESKEIHLNLLEPLRTFIREHNHSQNNNYPFT